MKIGISLNKKMRWFLGIQTAGAFCVTENVNMFDFPPDVKMLDWGTSAASARIKLKKRKGNDLSELPEEFHIRQLPK